MAGIIGCMCPPPPLISALLQPQRFPGAVQQVTLVETHISWVLLAGDFAYKIKKPVKLPFLDFSTLALRHQACLDELRLNRRFAADIYLDVLPLFNTPQDPQWRGAGEPIEYAVRMHRFDESGRLDRVCARGELLPVHLSELAATLVTFHTAAASAPLGSRFGTPAQVMAPARDNFADLKRLLPQLQLPRPSGARVQVQLTALAAWTEAQGQALAALMQQRQAAGQVRECHGDLHLANLVLIGGRVRLFDCIEFNDDLRWIDVASDIAFTWIDLLAHQQPGLANWFLNAVLSHSGDHEVALLLRFYAVYRCLVRAKVAAIRDGQTHTGAQQVLAHIAQAQVLAAPPAARLLITHGLSGCGKTWLTDRLLQRDPQAATLRLCADVERKRLFGLERHAASGSGVNSGLYTPEAHAQTYCYLHDWAGRWLRAGWSVVVDATFLQRADRDRFRALAQACGAGFGILAPQATPAQLRGHILARSALGQDASEATLAVLAQQQLEYQPLAADELALIRPA
jgi:aminoglycoside phosphotransferase family enzyme/predicted kinase